MGLACRLEPVMKTKDSAEPFRAAAKCGYWATDKDGLAKAFQGVEQDVEVRFNHLRLFGGCVICTHMDYYFIDGGR